MKSLQVVLWLAVACGVAVGQNARQTTVFTGTGMASAIRENSLSNYHTLTWTVSGTLSACSVQIDSSADGLSWSTAGLLGSKTCTTSGTASVSAAAAYVRVNVTSFTMAVSGSLTVLYNGFATPPSPTNASLDVPTPVVGNSGQYHYKIQSSGTITRISCSTDQGTVSINLDVRTEASPNAIGTSVLSSDLVCTTTTGVASSIDNPTFTANAPIALIISATSGSPSVLRVHVASVYQ